MQTVDIRQFNSFFVCFSTLRRFFLKTTGRLKLILPSLERGGSPLSFWSLCGALLPRGMHVRGLRPLKPPFFRKFDTFLNPSLGELAREHSKGGNKYTNAVTIVIKGSSATQIIFLLPPSAPHAEKNIQLQA